MRENAPGSDASSRASSGLSLRLRGGGAFFRPKERRKPERRSDDRPQNRGDRRFHGGCHSFQVGQQQRQKAQAQQQPPVMVQKRLGGLGIVVHQHVAVEGEPHRNQVGGADPGKRRGDGGKPEIVFDKLRGQMNEHAKPKHRHGKFPVRGPRHGGQKQEHHRRARQESGASQAAWLAKTARRRPRP